MEPAQTSSAWHTIKEALKSARIVVVVLLENFQVQKIYHEYKAERL